jgi:CBS domain-containing protein/sporulation protein YlmC with PRC-barrel domain
MAISPEPQVFLFLSEILGKRIIGATGEKIGRIHDLTAEIIDPYPIVTGIIVKSSPKNKRTYLPWREVLEINGDILVSIRSVDDLMEIQIKEGDLLLNDALMDKQVVDTHGAKIRRVNDLQFLKTRHGLHLVHVDVGFRGLIRRVGLIRLLDAVLQGLFDYTLSNQLISWKFTQPLSSPDLLRLNIAQNRLSQLHPADLADILEDLDIKQRAALFQSLDVETAAETLEETDPKVQVSLITDLNSEKASDIIEEMSLSEAADLIGDLPKAKAEGILKEMEKDIADDVKELMSHPEQEAGGMMTTSFLSFRPSISVSDALDQFRQEAADVDWVHYVYITDEEEHLLGVVSLRDLILADPDQKMQDIMDQRVVSVKLDDKADKIADQFAKYALTAMPVVDDQNHIHGAIIFKNLLDIVAPQLGK